MVGFNFTLHMRRLCADMVTRLDVLRHIDLDRVAIRFCQARRPGQFGIQASLTPLRFAGGSTVTRKRGRQYGVERILDANGREMLYLLSFYLPRYQNRSLADKLQTVVHELWHIGPDFDGDIRRHHGRCYAHSGSQKKYDAVIERLTNDWLALQPPADLYEFLRFDFHQLTRLHGSVFGARIATPKLVPLPAGSG